MSLKLWVLKDANGKLYINNGRSYFSPTREQAVMWKSAAGGTSGFEPQEATLADIEWAITDSHPQLAMKCVPSGYWLQENFDPNSIFIMRNVKSGALYKYEDKIAIFASSSHCDYWRSRKSADEYRRERLQKEGLRGVTTIFCAFDCNSDTCFTLADVRFDD